MADLIPFNAKTVDYIHRALRPDCWLSVAEGGKRASKNLMNTLGFCIDLENHPDKIHFCMGATIASAKINILDSNGLGVENYYRYRYREGKYKNRDAVFVQTKAGEKIILPLGGGKLGDEKLFRGFTFGTGIITEAPKLTPIAIQESFDRTISSSRRKLWLDLNPEPPKHWIYKDLLDRHEKMQRINDGYGYNYEHFTIYDNTSLTDEQIDKVLSTYDQTSVWFLRDILGLRAVAEGNIFRQVADNPQNYLIAGCPPDVALVNYGIDFGGNKSKTTFVCVGINSTFTKVYILAARKLNDSDSDLDMQAVNEALHGFHNWVKTIFPALPVSGAVCYADNENQLAIKTMQQYCRRHATDYQIKGCNKGTILDRIRCKTFLLNNGGYYFHNDHAGQVLASTIEQTWDQKKHDVRLDDGTADIDTADAEEYAWTPFIKYLMRGAMYAL